MSEFNSNVIQWVEYDNQIKQYNEKIKSIKSDKSTLEVNILSHIENNDLKNNVFNLASYSSKLQYNSNKSYETMTNKYLLDNFTKYFNDGNKAKELLEFLKNNRKFDNKVSLKRN
jgi:hypothetical protein|tara:strand:+ start:310 stop:654 length:345 start_codon:yes stop_codon:yes gene_type:complete